ncbi:MULTISPECIES: hypothetical protein [Kosakonia]|uniref:hypothetical protein n=2 Tax=Kosakonia TaxID=1330547 RepID=UPI0005EF4E5B|nr:MULTISPECIES: hypothetical protein [Kosakonia]
MDHSPETGSPGRLHRCNRAFLFLENVAKSERHQALRVNKGFYFYGDTKRNEVLHMRKHRFEIGLKNMTIDKQTRR